jgi:C1A family cysteine protease
MPVRAFLSFLTAAKNQSKVQSSVRFPVLGIVGLAFLLAGCSAAPGSRIVFSNALDWHADLVLFQPASGGPDLEDLTEGLEAEDLSPRLSAPAAVPGGQMRTLEFAGEGGPEQVRRLIYGELNQALNPLRAETRLTLVGAVHAGEPLTFSFETNPSTGYAWQAVGYDPAWIQAVGEPHYETRGIGIGSPAKESQQFTAVRDGIGSIQWIYRRGWDSGPAGTERSLTIQAPDLAAISDLSNPLAVASTLSLPAAQNVPVPLFQLQAEANMPASFDWRTRTTLTSVRNQGDCGSCWAFATVGVLEAAISIHYGSSPDLSEQYLVSCNTGNWGCSGGFTAHNYHENIIGKDATVPGAVLESSFPYVGWNPQSGKEQTDLPCGGPYQHPYQIQSWAYVANGTAPDDQIKQAILQHGPVETMVCAGNGWRSYTGGIYSHNDSAACGGFVNHAVDLVGWNDNMKDARGGSHAVWIVRNSWGTGWGDQGYMYIDRGISGIGYATSYVNYDGAGAAVQSSSCQATKILACGGQVDGRNDQAGSTNLTSSYACSSRSETGPEVTYRFDPTVDGQITARLSNLTADLDIFALNAQGAGCTKKDCQAAGDSQVTIDVKAGQPLYLNVDGNQGAVGDFTLSIQCSAKKYFLPGIYR